MHRYFDLETVPWASQVQTILHAFPELLPDRKYGDGWEAGYHCGGPDNSIWPEISCSNSNSEPYLVIMDMGDYDSVLNQVGLIPGLSADRPVAHPAFDDPLVGNSRMRVSDGARVIVRFPADSAKSRFLLMISWPGHGNDDVFDHWLPQLPISP